jgi:hypothetical protein
MQYLLNWPVSFGEYSSESTPVVSTTICSLYNSNLTADAWSLSCFDWAVYGFNSGHFSHLSTRWDFHSPSSLHPTSMPTAALYSPSSSPALVQSMVGVVLFWTISRPAEPHQSCLDILSIPGTTIAPSRQADSGSCRLQLSCSSGSPACS